MLKEKTPPDVRCARLLAQLTQDFEDFDTGLAEVLKALTPLARKEHATRRTENIILTPMKAALGGETPAAAVLEALYSNPAAMTMLNKMAVDKQAADAAAAKVNPDEREKEATDD